MPVRQEVRQIMFLLDSGDWGELAGAVEELKQKGELLFDAEAAFSAKFEEVEEKRREFFLKRFATLNTGICRTHSRYAELGADDIFPLNQLKVVCVKVIPAGPHDKTKYPVYERAMCIDCITKQSSERPYPPVELRDKGVPTPEQFWRLATDDEIRKLARHFRMPSLRDFDKVCEEAEKKRRG